MVMIHKAILDILGKGYTPKDISDSIGVSTPMISTWKNVNNDYIPRLDVAIKIFKEFDIIIYPYDLRALDGTY